MPIIIFDKCFSNSNKTNYALFFSTSGMKQIECYIEFVEVLYFLFKLKKTCIATFNAIVTFKFDMILQYFLYEFTVHNTMLWFVFVYTFVYIIVWQC